MKAETLINTLPVEFLVECYASHDAKKQAFYREAVQDNSQLASKISQIASDRKVIKNLNKELYKIRKREATRTVKALAEIVTNSKNANSCDHTNAIWTETNNESGYIVCLIDGFCPTCLNRISKINKAF